MSAPEEPITPGTMSETETAREHAELPTTSTNPAPAGKRRPPRRRKRSGPLLLAAGGILVFGLTLVLATTGFTLLKAQKAGVTVDLIRKQPALAAAAIGVSANPGLELISIDQYRNRLTYKEKLGGQTRTVTPDELKRASAPAAAGGSGSGGILSKLARLIGFSGSNLPAWLPRYPGSSSRGVAARDNRAGGLSGVARFTTGDSPDKVVVYYEDALRDAGLSVKTVRRGRAADGALMTARGSNGSRNVTLMIASQQGRTTISISFTQQS